MKIGIDIDSELQRKAERHAANAGYPSVSVWISDFVKRELLEKPVDPVDRALKEIFGSLDQQRVSGGSEKLDGVKCEIRRLLDGLREDKPASEERAPRAHVMAAYKNSRRRFDSVYRRLAQ
jgi:hypothetical protein